MNGFLTYLTANVWIISKVLTSKQRNRRQKKVQISATVRYASRRKKTEDRRWYEV